MASPSREAPAFPNTPTRQVGEAWTLPQERPTAWLDIASGARRKGTLALHPDTLPPAAGRAPAARLHAAKTRPENPQVLFLSPCQRARSFPLLPSAATLKGGSAHCTAGAHKDFFE